jgi:hypothetical protein
MQSIPDDEIDLGRIGRRVKNTVTYPFRLWMSNIKTTLLFILFALAFAIAIKYALPRTYRSSFIIRPIDKNEKFHLKMIADVQQLLKNRDYNTIATELKLDVSTASSIAALYAVNPFVKNRTDSINNTEITIDTYDYNQLLHIQNSLLAYLENNPYFKKITELQKKQISQSLELVESDLFRLDKLKQLQINSYDKIGVPGQNALLLNDMVNPTQVYTMAAERMNKKASLLAQLAFLDNFQLVKSCVIVKQHRWPPRILLSFIILVPVLLLIEFLFLHYRRKPTSE